MGFLAMFIIGCVPLVGGFGIFLGAASDFDDGRATCIGIAGMVAGLILILVGGGMYFGFQN